jgi:hypothetical protein
MHGKRWLRTKAWQFLHALRAALGAAHGRVVQLSAQVMASEAKQQQGIEFFHANASAFLAHGPLDEWREASKPAYRRVSHATGVVNSFVQ